jgi:hypothetical protein
LASGASERKTPSKQRKQAVSARTPENMQRAALEIERGKPMREVAALFGVSRQAVEQWAGHPDWPMYVAAAKAIVRQEAVAAAAASNIIPIRDGIEVLPTPVAAPEGGDLEDHAIEVLRTALQSGCVKSAMWVLERKAPERWGTPKDRQAMLELAKVSLPATERTVRVVITAPAKRKAASGA